MLVGIGVLIRLELPAQQAHPLLLVPQTRLDHQALRADRLLPQQFFKESV